MEKLGITLYAQDLIQMIGVGCGLWMLVGFARLLHKIWDRPDVPKVPSLLALVGLVGEVLALAYMPQIVWLVLPFSFLFIGNYLWRLPSRNYEVILKESGTDEVKTFGPIEPVKSTDYHVQYILIVVLIVALSAGLSRQGDTIAVTSKVASQKTDTLIQEARAAKTEARAVKQEVKAERDTSAKIRKKMLKADTLQLKKLDELLNKKPAVKTVYLPGKVKYVEVNTNPIASTKTLPTQPTNLTTIIKRPSPTVTKPAKKTFLDRLLHPFSYVDLGPNETGFEGGYEYMLRQPNDSTYIAKLPDEHLRK